MTDMVNKLMAVLASLEEQYRQLLVEMDREKQAALTSNPEMMHAVVARKQELMATLSGLEKQRLGLLQQIAARLRKPVGVLNLTTLSQHLGDMRIQRIGLALTDLLAKVKRANDENRALIEHCMTLVQNALGFFQHWMTPVAVYGEGGRISDGPLSGKLLSGLA